ncbi:MAG: flippase-like domain-containing protein [Deltaproteobacteria bacterium]|nr:flippase-like domain-containing protein [Deltaproteobacteria bacterium]
MNRKKVAISLGVGLAISAAALYLSVRNVDFSRLVEVLFSINFWWAIPAFAAIAASFVVRVYRWRLILGPMVPTRFWEAYHPTMIGFAVNCILPGRVGELARPGIISRERGASFFGVFATIAAERVFDLISLLILFALVMKAVTISPDFTMTFGKYTLSGETLNTVAGKMLKLVAVLVVGIILVGVYKTRAAMAWIIMESPRLVFFLSPMAKDAVKRRVCQPVVNLMERTAQGFVMLKSPLRIGLCLAMSFAVWALLGVSWWLMSLGCPFLLAGGQALSIWDLTAAMVIVAFFISLPSVPGFWGLWEAGGIFALALFGVAAEEALSFNLVNHVVQMVPVIAMGGASAVVKGVNIWNLAAQKEAVECGEEKTGN